MSAKRALFVLVPAAAILAGLWIALPGGSSSDGQAREPAAVGLSAEVGPTIDLDDESDAHHGSVLLAAGSVWVTRGSPDGDSVLRIDPGTNRIVARIPIGPFGAAPGWEVGGGGIAEGAGAIWVVGTAGRGALLTRIDPGNDEVVATIDLDARFGGDAAVTETGVWCRPPGIGSRGGSSASIRRPVA